MDVFDVGHQYANILDHRRRVLEQAKIRKGERPQDRKSREQAYAKFMLALTIKSHLNRDLHTIHSSFIPPAYPPCTTPTRELKSMMIRELQLETHHRGRYLLLRSITPANRSTAIMAIMEDENLDVVMLQLYQQEDEEIRPAAEVVSVGTIVLVKEPYFKVMADGEYGLRVDHICDVVPLEVDDPKIPDAWRPKVIDMERSAESLKMRGNEAVGAGKYYEAIKYYSAALRQPATAEEIEIIKRNRSLAFLKTKQFDAALADTGFPNLKSNPTEKGLFRAAEALYYLERFSECCEVLDILRTEFPNNKQAVTILDRARRRLAEQKTGTYDFKQLQATAKKLRPPILDYATYMGPVEVRETKSKGRGLFVTKAVKAGDLLLCEKAFSYAFADKSDKTRSKITLLMNLETNRGFMGAQADLITKIVHKLSRNPSVAPKFTTLYHGAYQSVSTMSSIDTEAIVDTFLVDRILSFNVFGCGVSSLEILKDTQNNKKQTEEAHHSCGIWTQASYINHSCTSNARRAFIGDMMIVRAARDLEPGTEVTFWYHSPDGTGVKELQEKLKNWGFVCECAICADGKTTKAAVHAERKKLMQKMEQLFGSSAMHTAQISQMERLLKALDATYERPAAEVPRLLLWDPQLALTRIYSAQNNTIKSLEGVGKVLVSLGFVVVGLDRSATEFRIAVWGLMVDHLVETFLHARNAFVAIGAGEDAERAEDYAKTAYRIIVGEDTSFNAVYG